MELVIGVEAAALIAEIPEMQALMNSDQNLIHLSGTIYIYQNLTDAMKACDLLLEAGLYENMHPIVLVDSGRLGECFHDYGFRSGAKVFLFKDLLTAFYLEGEDPEQVEMAKAQIEEHLVFETLASRHEVLFVDQQFDSLMLGIAKAYNCIPRFLDLDK